MDAMSVAVRRAAPLLAAAVLLALCGGAWAGPIVLDTFTRPDSSDLGTTEDAGHYAWIKGPYAPESAMISSNTLYLAPVGAAPDGVYLDKDRFVVKDFDLSVKVKITPSPFGPGWYAFLLYRSDNPGTEDYSAFNLEISDTGMMYLYTNVTGHLAGVNTGLDWVNQYHVLRLRVEGQNHKCWVDGNLMFDVTTPYNDKVGTFSLCRRHAGVNYDDLSLESLDVFATVKGTVTNQETGLPVEGAKLTCSTQSQTTGSDGKYQFDNLVAGPVTLTAQCDGYYPVMKSFTLSGGEVRIEDIALAPLGAPTAVVFDTFTREDNVELGTTEDAGAYPWRKSAPTEAVRISQEMMSFTSAGAGASIAGFYPKDFEISAKVTSDASVYTGRTGIAYRSLVLGAEDASGYSVTVDSAPDPQILRLNGHGQVLATAHVPVYMADFWAVPGPTLRIKAVGRHHQVFVNDVRYIDYLDTSNLARLGGGFCTFIDSGVPAYFDDLNINSWQDDKAGSLSGQVTAAGSPLVGAEVGITGIGLTTTGDGGNYTLSDVVPGTHKVSASYPGYLPDVKTVTIPAGGTATQNFSLPAIPEGVIVDTFTRDMVDDDIGTTEDPSATPWLIRQGTATITPMHNLFMPVSDTRVRLGDKMFKDFEIEYDGKLGEYGPYGLIVLFHVPDSNPNGDKNLSGHMFHVQYNPNNVWYIWNPTSGHTAGVLENGVFRFNEWHHFKLRVVGTRHTVWIDGLLRWDANTAQPWFVDPGYVFLETYGTESTFDNVVIRELQTHEVSVSGAKELADGQLVRLTGQIVTCVQPGFIYIEEPNRSSGIKVLTSAAVNVGDSVRIEGEMGTTDTERHVKASSVTVLSSGNQIKPVAITGRTADASEGLSAIGLFVAAFGEVKVVNPAAHHIAIQDGGSDPWVILSYPDGITLPEVGDYVVGFGALGIPPGNPNEKIVWLRTPADFVNVAK